MDDDSVLLRKFVKEGSQEAFAELIRRHIGLVYSAALRQLSGDAHRAEDATQLVFTELAAKAPRLENHSSVSGWLYNTARFVAARTRRADMRRHERERRFGMTNEPGPSTTPSWSELEPVIDDAMQELGESDREALILRFFQNESFVTVGQFLHASEDAARMRVNRALDKLRGVLERRGITSSSAVLSGLLAAHSVSAPPAALASAVAASVLAVGGSATGGLAFIPFMASAKVKVVTSVLACAALGSALVVREHQNGRLHEELRKVRAQLSELEQVASRSAGAPAPADDGRLSAGERSDLLRLRGEVTQLREELARERTAKQAQKQESPIHRLSPEQAHEMRRMVGIGKLNFSRLWADAFHQYAVAHEGQMPQSFSEAAEFLPPIPTELNWVLGMTGPQDFEIVYRGPLTALSNAARVIIAREKAPFDVEETGAAKKTYIFADGHSEIHRSPTGDFEAWERERMVRTDTLDGASSVGGVQASQ